MIVAYIDDLVQDCTNSRALATELLQSCTKPSMLCGISVGEEYVIIIA